MRSVIHEWDRGRADGTRNVWKYSRIRSRRSWLGLVWALRRLLIVGRQPALLPVARAPVGDSGNSADDGTGGHLPSSARSRSLATAATASPPADTPHCNTATPATAPGRTARTPSTDSDVASTPLRDALYPLPYPSASLRSRPIVPAPGRHFPAGRPPPTTAGHPPSWPAKWSNRRPPLTGKTALMAHSISSATLILTQNGICETTRPP